MPAFIANLLLGSTWQAAGSWVARHAVQIVVAVLIAAVVFLVCRNASLSIEKSSAQSKAVIERTRANNAELDLAKAQRTVILGDEAVQADQDRQRELDVAATNEKGAIDAIERKRGAAPVDAATRDYLRRVRQQQR
jgi:hypothetical protein